MTPKSMSKFEFTPASFSFSRSRRRSAITIIELLIAVALTLILIGAMVQAFKRTSDEISSGRAQMQVHGQMRTVSETLRRDLQMATCLPRISALDEKVAGGFEVIEGDETEMDHNLAAGNSHFGDHDDILWLTVRSTDKPFRGRFTGSPTGYVESNLAEIMWWVVHDDTSGDGEVQYDENIRLYRRVLLIRPDLTTAEINFDTFYADNDISVRRDPIGGGLLMNSLPDLANRRNRFAHDAGTFPHEVMPAVLALRPYTGVNEGEDLVLDHCITFDVRLFSPNAPIKHAAHVLPAQPSPPYGLETTDDGYAGSAWASVDAGGYVDPGNGVSGWFSAVSANAPGYTWTNFPRTWCSWFPGYEFDGIDQNADGIVDNGTNGVDDDGANGVDDAGEYEAPAPYSEPIRAIQISIRVIEKRSNKVKQTSIKESFVPN